MYDCLIIGGGVAGIQCALVLGSAYQKRYAKDKKIGIITHQDKCHLKKALFNNVLGLPAGTLGGDLMNNGLTHLATEYPHIEQLSDEQMTAISDREEGGYFIKLSEKKYVAKNVIIAFNYAKPFDVIGLNQYLEPHSKANVMKDRVQLRNFDHLIKQGLYVCGTLAGHRSQFAIAAGSGAAVATDILTLWNDGVHAKIHDKLKR